MAEGIHPWENVEPKKPRNTPDVVAARRRKRYFRQLDTFAAYLSASGTLGPVTPEQM